MHKKPRSRSNFSQLFRQLTKKLRSRKYSATCFFLILFSWSTLLGWGMAVAFDRPSGERVASVDPVTKPYQLGQEFYVENCSSCHVPVPPEVLPTATWKTILENPQDHYGVKLEQLYGPQRLLIWTYLRDFSRSLMAEEPEPSSIARSRYFKAIHPQVEFKEPISVKTCITCHPSAAKFNYRNISPTTPPSLPKNYSKSLAMNYLKTSFNYPETRQDNTVDTYGDVRVKDPYRWLEDPHSEETKAWIAAQNNLTFSYLESIPSREKIKNRISQIWNYEKYGIPFKEGDRYFYFKNDGLQNQNVLYTLKSLQDEPKVLIDPNNFSEDGTVSLAEISVSQDGNLIAYGISRSGSDWQEWKVKDIETGKDLEDTVKWVKFSSASWTKDNKGFFYSRYDEPNENTKLEDTNFYQKLYYHPLGTPQSEDILIYDRPDKKEWGFWGQVSEDGRYLVVNVWRGTERKNLVFYKDLQDKNAKVVELISEFEASYSFIDNDRETLWFKTNFNAPKDRVIAIDLKNPHKENWQEKIPEAEETIENVSLVNNKFIVNYLKDARSLIKFFSLNGTFIGELKSPGIGYINGFGGKRTDKETFYSFTSFTTPTTIYKYNLETNKTEIFRQPQVEFNPEDYEVKQVFYNSKDGTKIPMFITHKKGIKLDGNNPTLLYGYGGFNISLTPNFSISNLVWMEMGGVYGVPNIRGGGEYGQEWHQAGMKDKKQNVFDDFIAAAEWLIKNNYTNNKKIAIFGGSNGGLLVGACMTQRPELFGAALPAVGVLDMLRFDKFTIGWAWRSEYGDPANPEDFKTLYAYSPLHNIKPGTSYPATLITTADTDDRVVPAHSFKFTAALQAVQAGNNPILIRIETKAGHGAGTPTDKIIEASADRFAFLTKALDIEY